MSGGEVVIHFNGANELFDIDDFNVTTVDDLLKLMQCRIYGNDEKLIPVSRDYLCDGPYAPEPLSDVRLREIIQMIQQPMTQDSINEKSEKGQRPVELWLCNYTNNGFLFGNSSTTSKQHNSKDTIPVWNNDNSKQIHVQTHDPKSTVSQPSFKEIGSVPNISSQYTDDTLNQLLEEFEAHPESIKNLVESWNPSDGWDQFFEDVGAYPKSLEKSSESCNASNVWDQPFEDLVVAYLKSLEESSESCNASNDLSNENVLKFTNDFRKKQKKQYRSDVFPLKKNKKVKKNKSSNTKAASQTANKKRKFYENKKKYAFHLQAVEFKKGCSDGKYPRVQLPRYYFDLIRKRQVVPVFVAATKYINGRRYLDATKGILIDKENPKTPLENPCIIKFEWIARENPPPTDFPLKLVLIQVSGDKNRKSKVEYNENFNFAQRTVDETSKYSDYDSTDDTDEPEEFQITVVPVKGDALSEADWPMSADSNLMHYVNRKSDKKQKTNSSLDGSSSVQEQLQTTQDNEEHEEEDDDDDEEEEEDNNDEE